MEKNLSGDEKPGTEEGVARDRHGQGGEDEEDDGLQAVESRIQARQDEACASMGEDDSIGQQSWEVGVVAPAEKESRDGEKQDRGKKAGEYETGLPKKRRGALYRVIFFIHRMHL